MAKKKPREAEPGELRGIHILESLERLFKRPETRLDAQRMLGSLSPDGQAYAKHLVMSGPSSNKAAAKTLALSLEQFESAAIELEMAVAQLRR